MIANLLAEIRKDCLVAAVGQESVWQALAGSRLAVTGGTGFLGTWLAEMIVALNDEFQCNIALDIYSDNTRAWQSEQTHFASRSDIQVKMQDVRSPFEFHPETRYVIHAAGMPDNRAHASDPLRVFQTTVSGAYNVLNAATKLINLSRLLNISSGLVNGVPAHGVSIREDDIFPFDFRQLHAVYPEAKRAAENLCTVFASQFRLPVCTIRPFTFLGPYQSLDCPWAVNSFMRDALLHTEIRLHGDGQTQRSYLYGSDAACWLLCALIRGRDGEAYNLGSAEPVRHSDLAEEISRQVPGNPRVVLRTLPNSQSRSYDFLPEMGKTMTHLGVHQTCSVCNAIARTMRWHAARLGSVRP